MKKILLRDDIERLIGQRLHGYTTIIDITRFFLPHGGHLHTTLHLQHLSVCRI